MNKIIRAGLVILAFMNVSGAALALCTNQTISFGETKNGVLATDDCLDKNGNGFDYYYDYYEFTATAGQQISITNTSTVIDPDLLLIFPDDSRLYNDNAGGAKNARIPDNGFLTLGQSGKYIIVASSGVPVQVGAYTLTLNLNAPPPPPPPPPMTKQTVEFYNVSLNHYFVTAEVAEATAIDNGSAGPGWVRTGFSYNVFGAAQVAGLKAGVTNPVCRFYGTPGVGPNSHFYTADDAECIIVKRDPGWFYEGIAYHIQQPQFGNCPAGTQPIYRAYNLRAQANDSNHRFITNPATFLAMGDQGWSMEGLVMCTTGVRSPTPVTGGTFKDPNGAGITIAAGALPASANATGPSSTTSPRLPPGMTINPARGEMNVTKGGTGVDVNLTGDSGFSTTTPGAVTISVPFDAAAIAPGDLGNPVKVVVRVFDPQDNSQVDLAGTIALTGSTGMLTVETRGLPRRFTAAAIYSRDLDGITSDQAPVSAIEPRSPLALKVAKATWPAQSWCIIYNQASPELIAAVKTVLGIAGNPTQAQIRSVILDKVGGSARKAQTTYENDGHIGPNLVINQACGAGVSRYNIHLVTQGSFFQGDDPGEVVSSGAAHFGRLYISDGRVDDAVNTNLGSSLASVAHEMHHSIQSASRISTGTTKGYTEGAATIYGKAIDNTGTLKVRSETEVLGRSLMNSDPAFRHGNEDFFTYAARQYNAGSLNYLSGLYAQMSTAIGGANNPAPSVSYGAMDTVFKAAFPAQTLQTIYLDFLKQRVLTHNASSQFGRAGEVVAGFAPGLLGGGVTNETVDVTTCGAQKITRTYPGIDPFAARAVVVAPTGAVPAASPGPTLVIKVTPAASTIGALWNGFTYRGNTAAAVAASNKFAGFGKAAGDQVVILMANLDPANAGAFSYEISCGGLNIDSISPTKGPVDTVVTINGTGFGTATDTRAIYFNGLKATTVTFVSDTQATAKVPANASSGDVVVEVNAQRSNGVPFEVVAQCSNTQNAGGDTPDTRTIELGKPAGTFNFTYETYAQEDQIVVRYQTTTLFDTGCVGANGTVPLTYSGTSTSITVQVIPNCKGGSGTAWNYSVSCP